MKDFELKILQHKKFFNRVIVVDAMNLKCIIKIFLILKNSNNILIFNKNQILKFKLMTFN